MIIKDIINEANAYKKVNEPRLKKMIALAVMHDGTFPRKALASLGKNPKDDDVVKLLSDLIDRSLSNTNYGDISRDGKYDQWLLKKYADGAIDYEDLTGEGADALGAFKTLSIRGLLNPQHQDINKIRTIRQLVSLLASNSYAPILRRLKDEEKIKQLKKDKKDIVLIDDDRFYVAIPLNYGACYVFNNEVGIQASFCTGSSSTNWFYRYAADGPMIDVLDKKNIDNVFGKWQIHAPTNQIKDAKQDYNSTDSNFAKLFPGLLKRICDAMNQKKVLINELSSQMVNPDRPNVPMVPSGYDVDVAITQIKNKFPLSYESKATAS